MNIKACLCFLTLTLSMAAARAQGTAQPPSDLNVPAGHSYHGEVFNEGPRQKAYLMKGTGRINFPVTTKSAEAQALFNQGVGQLHGFWYFEAERSFRQVATIDPDCAMAYWGMAQANVNNRKRAQGFIKEAVKRKAHAGKREAMWIDAYASYLEDGRGQDKDRRRDLVRALENIIYEFPAELEGKAFLAFQVYENIGRGWPLPSNRTLESLVNEVLAVEPMHPAHHYLIHLWDGDKAVRALKSASLCGQAAPSIAHMWHMPGHIFTQLKRYADAAWYQEASARVDHAHMMRDRVLPDQIHNYAHNNQWCVENLEYVGRAHDAVELAKNLLELPRHPRYNTMNGSGSARQGRNRLFETLQRYEMWDEVIALQDTMYLEPTDMASEQARRLRLIGMACFGKGDRENGAKCLAALEELQKNRKDANADSALAELRGYLALSDGDSAKAIAFFNQSKDISKDRLARICMTTGETERSEKLAREDYNAAPQQVFRIANLVDILHRCGKDADAKEQLDKLRDLSSFVDLDVPMMQRLTAFTTACGLPSDWRSPVRVAPDVGKRPNLNDLGPFRWQPMPAADWTLTDSKGKRVSLKDYRGRPLIVIFYLGAGCPHCIEQLNAFEPMIPQYAAAGIAMVAVSTESVEGLQKTFEKSKLPADFTLVSDQSLKTFKGYRAFDDFENLPLHGTFLIDGNGLVRWQDISYQPFKDVKFLLEESKRLLSILVAPPATLPRRK